MNNMDVLYLKGKDYGNKKFYSLICNGFFKNFVLKEGTRYLSIDSYDAFIIDLTFFNEKTAENVVKKIIETNKPIIFIYSTNSFEPDGRYFLSQNFNIIFEEKDCSLLENEFKDCTIENYKNNALSMIDLKDSGKIYIKNTKNCFIIKQKNISIIHDLKVIKFYNRDEIEEILKYLLNIEQDQIPDWVYDLEILDNKKIKEELKKIDLNLEKLNNKKQQKLKKLENNNGYKKVLFTSGNELVDVVKIMLHEMLETEINNEDIKKEDLSFTLNNKKIMVEIKGINTNIKRENVRQTVAHIQDDAIKNSIDDNEIEENYKGLLIVNPYIKTPIKERINKDFYSESVKSDIIYHNVCTIDTITFLSMYSKFRSGKKVKLKEMILNNNYIEPDFSVLKGEK